MAKLQKFIFISALLPLLSGFPLEDDSSSTYSTKQQPHVLKVNPLLAIDVQQQKHENDSNDKDDNSSTEPAVREETHIEVLLPGSQQLNSSVLEALLIGPSSTPADTDSKGEHLQSAETSHYNAQVRPVRDTSSGNEGDDSSEEKPSKIPSAVPGSTVAPVLYSAYGEQNKRKSDSQEDDSSNENSSEEQVDNNRPHVSTTFLSGSPQSSNGRVVRDNFEKPSPNKSSGGPANDGSSTIAPVLYSGRIVRRNTEEKSTTEKVVIVTSKSEELRQSQSPLAAIPLKTQN